MISGKLKGIFVGIADQVAPVLLPLLDKLKAIDLVPIGEQLGRAVRAIASAFEEGRIGELFGASLEVGVDRAVNYLVGAMAPVSQALSTLVGSQLDALMNSLEPMVDGFTGLLGAGLMKAFETPLRYFQAVIEASVETAQHLWDRARMKPEDKSGYGSMSDQERMALAQKYSGAAGKRFDEVRDQHKGESSEQIDHALNTDSLFQSLQQSANALRTFDPTKFATHVESVDEIMARHASDPVRFGTDGGQTGSQMQSDALASLRSAPAMMAKASADVMGTIRKFFADFHPANVMDEKAGLGRLSTLLGQLKGMADTVVTAPQKFGAQSGLNGITGNVSKLIEGDRLSKIGIHVGAGGPALDFHKRTAAATEATARGVALMTGHLISGGLTTGHLATWG